MKFRSPPRDLIWFEQLWRSRHAIANQALMAAGKLHPDKKIAKAARAARGEGKLGRELGRSG